MNDETAESGAEDLCGQRLKKAREDLGIPLTAITKELHLDEAKVEALERNEFAILGAPVFAKGHLRKYAQMVKVDVDQILFDYHQLTRANGLPPVVSNRTRPSMPKSPTPWILAGIVLLLAIAAWFGWQFYLAQTANTARVVPALSPVAVSEPVTLPSPEPVNVSAAETESGQEQPDVVAEPDVDVGEVADENVVSLKLLFSGDCWTEVTDASGDRLFFNLGSAGDEVNLEGDAPVSVLLGNAGHVSLLVNGRDYQIANADRNGDTARFTLYGS